jgi:hypothetical protein
MFLVEPRLVKLRVSTTNWGYAQIIFQLAFLASGLQKGCYNGQMELEHPISALIYACGELKI